MSAIRIGTRGSLLARTQSGHVRDALAAAHPDLTVEMVEIRTTGDRISDVALSEIGGKGLFTKELDVALLEGSIDLAVHSLKDVPTELPPGLDLVAVPPREDPRDVIVGPEGAGITLAGLPAGARVGTSSLRRQALLGAHRPDLDVDDVRGNLDTRLRKVDRGEFDAIVVAAAGVRRLGLDGRISEWLEPPGWLPATGQGALALVGRRHDDRVRALADDVHDPATETAVRAERAFLERLEGGCQIPIGALATAYEGGIRLRGLVASRDGSRLVRGDRTGTPSDAEGLGVDLAEELVRRGADDILREIRAAARPAPDHP